MSLAGCVVCGVRHPNEEHPAHEFTYVADIASLDDLNCPLTLMPLVDPYDVPCAGPHTFSGKVLFAHLRVRNTCPLCNERVEPAGVRPTSRLVRQKLDQLLVHCPYCTATRQRGDLREHLQQCALAPLTCVRACRRTHLRCADAHDCRSACAHCPGIAEAAAAAHAAVCEYSTVRCERCQRACPPRVREQHDRELCPERRVQCEGKCRTFMLARELPTHSCADVLHQSQKAYQDKVKRSLAHSNAQLASAEGLYKVVLVGDSNVGKTALLERHAKPDTAMRDTASTVGVDCRAVDVVCTAGHFSLQVWDTAGQERFASFTRGYFRHVAALLLAFDYSRKATLDNARMWLEMAHEDRSDGDAPLVVVMVGCKSDWQHVRPDPLPFKGYAYDPVSDVQAEQLSRALNAACLVKTSAKKNENVAEVFTQIAEALARAGVRPSVSARVSGPLSSAAGNAPVQSKGCC